MASIGTGVSQGGNFSPIKGWDNQANATPQSVIESVPSASVPSMNQKQNQDIRFHRSQVIISPMDNVSRIEKSKSLKRNENQGSSASNLKFMKNDDKNELYESYLEDRSKAERSGIRS